MKTAKLALVILRIAHQIRRAWPQISHSIGLIAAAKREDSDGGRELTDAEIEAIVIEIIDDAKPALVEQVLRAMGRRGRRRLDVVNSDQEV